MSSKLLAGVAEPHGQASQQDPDPASSDIDFAALPVASATVSTEHVVYIDPGAAVGGDGSRDHPFDSWKFGPIQAGTTYLQRAGTSYAGNVYVDRQASAAAPIVLGAYGDGAAPIIDGTVDFTGASYATLRGIHLTNPTGAAVSHPAGQPQCRGAQRNHNRIGCGDLDRRRRRRVAPSYAENAIAGSSGAGILVDEAATKGRRHHRHRGQPRHRQRRRWDPDPGEPHYRRQQHRFGQRPRRRGRQRHTGLCQQRILERGPRQPHHRQRPARQPRFPRPGRQRHPSRSMDERECCHQQFRHGQRRRRHRPLRLSPQHRQRQRRGRQCRRQWPHARDPRRSFAQRCAWVDEKTISSKATRSSASSRAGPLPTSRRPRRRVTTRSPATSSRTRRAVAVFDIGGHAGSILSDWNTMLGASDRFDGISLSSPVPGGTYGYSFPSGTALMQDGHMVHLAGWSAAGGLFGN